MDRRLSSRSNDFASVLETYSNLRRKKLEPALMTIGLTIGTSLLRGGVNAFCQLVHGILLEMARRREDGRLRDSLG
jgi:hypothetical protein